MLDRLTDFSEVSRAVFPVIVVLVLIFPTGLTYGSVYTSLLSEPRVTISTPPVALQSGIVGSCLIYTNGTSAKVSAAASATYDYVLRIVNQVSASWKIRLRAYSQSNIARLNNCTIYFHNATDGTSGQIYIISGSYTQQTGPWYDLPSSPAERYIALTLDASSSEVSYIYVYLDVLVPDKTTCAQYILTFEIT